MLILLIRVRLAVMETTCPTAIFDALWVENLSPGIGLFLLIWWLVITLLSKLKQRRKRNIG